MKSKLEYIWLDGTEPTQRLRGKTRIAKDFSGDLKDCPVWNFDGSSTYQATGDKSDCLLKPVAIYPDPDRKNAYIVMTEVLNADGTPHKTNGRAHIEIDEEDGDFWFGFEQEYFLYDPQTRLPLGFPAGGFPVPQGPYYCGVGGSRVFGRQIVEEHLDLCIEAGLNVEGINAEVAAGQWEFQIFAKGAHNAGDQIWVARYLLERTAEKYGIDVEWHPKPLGKDLDWNGSGMHANFSNGLMRTAGEEKVFTAICEEFGKHIQEHIEV
ncbi:MAG: glutamine synthetase beta-grasp domain-containing protein, partial [Prolixibacteraceae bacterium]